MEAYNTVNKIDIICLSESFLDSSILTENNNLKINGYKMMQKKGGVWAHIRESLPFRNFSNSYLTYFSPVSHFYTPWKRQKTKGFSDVFRGIEMWHWTKMG